jgi:hypothetical protein
MTIPRLTWMLCPYSQATGEADAEALGKNAAYVAALLDRAPMIVRLPAFPVELRLFAPFLAE